MPTTRHLGTLQWEFFNKNKQFNNCLHPAIAGNLIGKFGLLFFKKDFKIHIWLSLLKPFEVYIIRTDISTMAISSEMHFKLTWLHFSGMWRSAHIQFWVPLGEKLYFFFFFWMTQKGSKHSGYRGYINSYPDACFFQVLQRLGKVYFRILREKLLFKMTILCWNNAGNSVFRFFRWK